MVDRLLRASRPQNEAVLDGGVTSGVATMALTVNGGRIDIGLSSGLGDKSKCKISEANDVASLSKSRG